jgi:hypothetical protein
MPRVAFDLDNTLVRGGFDFPVQKPTRSWIPDLFIQEQLRVGTPELFSFCKRNGWETWIYTSSYRSAAHIRFLFWAYGVRLDGIVNQATHDKFVNVKSVKFPPSFGIDLLIDDSEFIFNEGIKLGYPVLLVSPKCQSWLPLLKNQLTTFFVKAGKGLAEQCV